MLNSMMRQIAILLILFTLSSHCYTQTCCTGGTPLLGSYIFSSFEKNDIILNSTFSYNSNKDLISGSDKLDQSFIRRTVSSFIVQTDYGVSNSLLLSVVTPFLYQNETIIQQGNSNKNINNGIGDMSLWARYQIVNHKIELNGAVGLKFPTGNTKERTESGILLPFSMQSGSGSYDIVANIQSTLNLTKNKNMTFSNQLAVKLNGRGKSFQAHPNYRFGNQFQLMSVYSYQYIIGTVISNAYVGTIYQFREKDAFNGGFENENTGGHWLNLAIGQDSSLTPRLKIGVNFITPLYRNLKGLQLSTTWQGSIIASFKLSKKDDTINLNSI